MNDLDERPWWIFHLPESVVAYVPADTENAARAHLVRTCYAGAPVHTWPCVGSRFTSRSALSKSFLSKRSVRDARGFDDDRERGVVATAPVNVEPRFDVDD